MDEMSTALRALAKRGVHSRYPRNTRLITEGDLGDTLYIVVSGRVKAFSTDDREREIIYGTYGAGDYFGEMSLDGSPRSASVATLEPSTCSTITRHTLLEHIADYPEFALELLSRVIRRARLATRSARDMAMLDVYSRVAMLLTELSTPQVDGTRVVTERLTHAAIAGRVGCSREMVSRLTKDLRVGGFTEMRGSQLVLLRPLPARW